MIINDLEHLELVSQANEVQGAALPLPFNPRDILGNAFSAFSFDSLVVGDYGAFAGGEDNILTTATSQGFTVGKSFTYTSLAIGPSLVTNGSARRKK